MSLDFSVIVTVKSKSIDKQIKSEHKLKAAALLIKTYSANKKSNDIN